MQSLSEKKCVPCMVGAPVMEEKKARELLSQVDDWQLVESARKITKGFKFKNFVESMEFVNKVAKVAESEGHHPDIFVSYSKVKLTVFTHKISGLTESDFVLAAKIDRIK